MDLGPSSGKKSRGRERSAKSNIQIKKNTKTLSSSLAWQHITKYTEAPCLCFRLARRAQRHPTKTRCGRNRERKGRRACVPHLPGQVALTLMSWVCSCFCILMTCLLRVHVSGATLVLNVTEQDDGQDQHPILSPVPGSPHGKNLGQRSRAC